MADASITDEELAELVQRTEDATSAWIRGDMDRYLELTPHARGFTLTHPFGGEPVSYDDRAESIRRRRATSRGRGEAGAGARRTPGATPSPS